MRMCLEAMFNNFIQDTFDGLKKVAYGKWSSLQLKAQSLKPYNLGEVALNGLTSNRGYTVKKNIAYGLKSRQRLDLYISQSHEYSIKPLIVFVHGGAWSRGDKESYKFLGETLTKSGYDVAVINYHLAPEHIFPTYVDDLALALLYLDEHQTDLGIHTEKIALMGHSAGAFNILSVLYRPDMVVYPVFEKIKTVIGIAGPYHFDYKGDPSSRHAFDETIPFEQVMPYYFVKNNNIHHYLLIAENDQLVKDKNSFELQQKLHGVANHCEVIRIPKTGHITIMGSIASVFSRFFKTRQVVINSLQQSLHL